MADHVTRAAAEKIRQVDIGSEAWRRVAALLDLHCRGAIDLRLPTKYAPGSPWKEAVISARYRLGMRDLFVDGDAKEWEPGGSRPNTRKVWNGGNE